LRTSAVGVRARYPGIIRFLFATNGQLTVKKTQSDFDVFVVGGLLGNFATGLLRVVKQVGSIPGRVFMPFEQVLYTELTRAVAVRDYDGFANVLRRFTGIVAVGSLAVWIVCAAAADPIVRILAGNDFIAAVPAFRWYLLAMVLLVIGAPVQRAVIALGRAGAIFMFDFATLLVLIGVVVAAAEVYGLVGVCVAIVAHKCAQLAWSAWYVARELGRARRASVA
jgi:PST family polysaccharide transporter